MNKDKEVIGYIVKNEETGLYLDGRYRSSMWAKKPRVFRSLRGIEASLQGLMPETLMKEYELKFPPPSTDVETDGVHHVHYTPEYWNWRRRGYEWIRQGFKEHGGVVRFYGWTVIPIKD